MTPKRARVTVPSTTAAPAADPVMAELGLSAPATPPPAAPVPHSPVVPDQQGPARKPLSVYVSGDVQEAARAAVWWTRNQPEGFENLSDLLEAALLDKIEALAAQYNAGKPFPPMPAGKRLRRGRPIGR